MNIPIPRALVRTWNTFVDWGDITIWNWGRIEVRRIDLLLAAFFIFSVSYYGYFAGWRGALNGAVVFVLVTTGSLLFRR
jgi:hypothetical protein